MYSKVQIIGNLGNDVELRYTAQGDAVASFSVATNRRWTNRDGQPGQETTWFRVSAWNKLAEVCNQYLAKGRQVFVEGRLVPDKETGGPRLWTDNEGNLRSSFELTAQTVQFLGSREGNGSGQGYHYSDRSVDEIAEEDIPF